MQQIFSPPKINGEPGFKYVLLGGMIRTDVTAPTGWGMKVDTEHNPCGIQLTGVKGLSSGQVDIQYETWAQADKIVDLLITPHRSAINAGFIQVGASVGNTSAKATLERYVKCSGRILRSGASYAWDQSGAVAKVGTEILSPTATPIWIITTGVNDKLSISMNGGVAQVFTLTAGTKSAVNIATELATLTGGTAVGTSGGRVVITSTTKGSTSKIAINDITNSCNATLGLTADTAEVNSWFDSTITTSGVQAVLTHTYNGVGVFDLDTKPVAIPYAGGYLPMVSAWSESESKIDFYSAIGTKVSALDDSCKCLFERQGILKVHSILDQIPNGITFWVTAKMRK